MSTMGDVAIDPGAVDALADKLNEKATEAIALRKRGNGLGVGQLVAPMAAVIVWAEGTSRALRVAADIARAGAGGADAFAALRQFGLPTAFGGVTAAAGGQELEDLQHLLDGLANATPEERADAVRAHFAKLSPELQAWLVANAPDVVGGLDGAPTQVRYAANRVLIQRRLEEERARFNAMPVDKNNVQWQRARDRIKRYEEFLVVGPPTQRYGPDGTLLTEPGKARQFLLFDPAGDGKVAEVIGDLDNASHVSVMVPGITNRMDNYDGIYRNGTALFRAADARQPGQTAVVTWLGYDTPQLGDSTLPDDAETAGPDLHSFRAGLNLRPGASTTLLAHSYGTLVSSKALQDGARFDRVVLMGSPGLGPDIHHARDLELPPGTEVFAMRAPGDPVSYSQGHGDDPADFDDLTRAATNVGTATDVSGHSSYYDQGGGDPWSQSSESLKNLTRITLGDTAAVTRTDTTVGEETSVFTVGPYRWSWGVAERRVVGVLNKTPEPVKRFLAPIVDPTLDTASEAIADGIDDVKAAKQGVENGYHEVEHVIEDGYHEVEHVIDDARKRVRRGIEETRRRLNPFD
jgi:pimeloyl-ACP methyl ester carboxylesterase